MNAQTFHLPDVGEGLTEAEIVNWLVAPGDEVALNQVVCEIETAKSLVELPSPFDGVVTRMGVVMGAVSMCFAETLFTVEDQEVHTERIESRDEHADHDGKIRETGACDV